MRLTVLIAFFLCGTTVALAGDAVITVVSYNIHHGEGTDGALDLDRIADIILALEPDVVCLQEVDQGCARTSGLDLPEEFGKRLNMDYRFGPNLDHDGGKYGNCTYSKLPIVDHVNFTIPFVEGGERRGCLRTTVEVIGLRVDVLNTHFDLLPAARVEQAAHVIESVRDVPTILAGDLNATPDSKPLRVLLGAFMDTFPGGDSGNDPGRRRIDYVLVSEPLNTVSSRFVDTPSTRIASDHLPYVAQLALPARDTALDRGIQNQDDRIRKAIFPEDQE
ncbi:MAG: hypothetical protein AMXMBFR82_47930 [Candidatus Hydrogenedentota bacterium]